VGKPSLSLFGLGAACAAAGLLIAAADPAAQAPATLARAVASLDKEVHLASIRQLTFGGENAEAYFSFDGRRLSFQSTRDGGGCDQIYSMKIDGSDLKRVSDGGRTTCAYFTPDGQHLIYASTVRASRSCPPVPDFSLGYVWPIYKEYDIFKTNADGSNLQPLTTTPGYDAEATIRADGRIVFTSVRDGDMEIYSMNGDGSDVRRLTSREGPDGGPFYSHDGMRIVFRGRTLVAGDLQDYRSLLTKALWRPTALEIFVMNADGSNLRQVTKLGAASFAPFFSPDDTRIIFSSNTHNPKGRDFELFMINVDGTGIERITYNDTFDGFPMFSPDGKSLVFASNRSSAKPGDTNVFLAEWKD
jgi:Tol biopolymer transport system component